VRFVDALVGPAEDMGHHPDLTLSWDDVTVSITNHAAGGLTEADFDLAKRIDALATG
jgi:4a-hydroxytetrahydrobiopterin dehydratase